MTSRTMRAMWTLVFASVFAMNASAQLALQMNSIDTSKFPAMTLRVTTRYNGLLRKDIDVSKYIVREDGITQSPLVKTCAVGTDAMSIVFVICTGSSLSQGDVSTSVGIAQRFVDSLDGFMDLGGIVTYNSNPYLYVGLNPDKTYLKASLATLGASTENNHLYDGVDMGLTEASHSTTPGRIALVVFSTGLDDGSAKTVTQVKTRAAALPKCRVYQYRIGNSPSPALEEIVNATGGSVFTDQSQCVESIINWLRGTPDYCELTYTSNYTCQDGLPRVLTVDVKNGTDSAHAQQSYSVGPGGAGTVTGIFQIDTARVTTGNTVTVPLRLKTDVTGQRFGPGMLELQYDRALLSLLEVKTDSTITKGVTASVVENATGATVTLSGAAALSGTGTVLRLVFRGGTVTQNTVAPVGITSLTFTRGCLASQTVAGSVTVMPKSASIKGTSVPYVFTWNAGTCTYDPSPSVLTVEVSNNGDLPVTGLTATLPNIPILRPAGGFSATVAVDPPMLAPGAKGYARWIVRVTPRDAEISQQVDVTIACAEGAQATAKLFMNIKSASSAVALNAGADTVKLNAGTYSPMPAVVKAVVRSVGNAAGTAGSSAIELPTGLTLASGQAVQAFGSIPAGQSQTLTWNVSYPTDLKKATTYDIRVLISGSCPATDTMIIPFRIPVDTQAKLASACPASPGIFVYDSVAKSHPVLIVRGRVRNSGLGASDSVFASLQPAAPLRLSAGETPVKLASSALAAGDSVDVEWRVGVEPGLLICRDLTAQMAYNVISAGSTITQCSISAGIGHQPNLLPEITTFQPAKLDSVQRGLMQAFSVAAVDADGDALTYRWVLDGVTVGENKNTHAQTFGQTGVQTLKCIVKDKCGMDSVVVTWTFPVVTALEQIPDATAFAITGNYPNPFNPGTMIEYSLPAGQHAVVLDVVDATGRVVARLASEVMQGGVHRTAFNAGALPSGSYTARLRSEGRTITHKMLLTK